MHHSQVFHSRHPFNVCVVNFDIKCIDVALLAIYDLVFRFGMFSFSLFTFSHLFKLSKSSFALVFISLISLPHSFMYSQNKTAANFDPCGTPMSIPIFSDIAPLNSVHCVRFVKELLNHSSVTPLIPRISNFRNNRCLSMVSNALFKSRKIATTILSLSTSSFHFLSTKFNADSHETQTVHQLWLMTLLSSICVSRSSLIAAFSYVANILIDRNSSHFMVPGTLRVVWTLDNRILPVFWGPTDSHRRVNHICKCRTSDR